ncbi:MAG: extracellular solute-binding protein [Phycisphaeraceae bacterium]|nr:extracellular solute-binding protein [Phycisphaeraceae bacterium]
MSAGSTANRVSRRVALGALGAGALAWAAWPRPSRDRARAPRGRKVLHYWEKWTGVEAVSLQHVIDEFNHSQQRLWVVLVPVSDISSKAMVAIGGGDPPDVCGLFSYSVPLYAEAGAAMPLDEFPRHDWCGQDGYLPNVWKLLTHEGRPWAAVNTCYTLGLYVNRAHAREAGLPESPPRTIAQLDAAADALTRTVARGRIERAGFLPTLPLWWPYSWGVLFDGRLYDRQTGRATADDPGNIRALEWISTFPRRFGREAAGAFAHTFSRSTHSPQDPFISGRASMIVQGPWLANFIARHNPGLDYAVAPVPIADGLPDPDAPRGLVEADVLIIPRGCKDPEASWEFLRFMQRASTQEQLAIAHCKSSPMGGGETSPKFLANHPSRFVGVFDSVARSPMADSLPPTRIWPQYADMLGGAFEAAWRGDDAAAALRDVQTRAQRLIDESVKMRARRAARGGIP